MKIFIDTSAFAAYFNQNDSRHAESVLLWNMLASGSWRMWTSSYVLAECVTVLRGRAGHAAALRFGEALMASQLVHLIRPSLEQDQLSMALFRKFKDQRFSYFDCSSFALMRDLGISRAFSFDKDFEIAGFDCLRA